MALASSDCLLFELWLDRCVFCYHQQRMHIFWLFTITSQTDLSNCGETNVLFYYHHQMPISALH